VLFFEVNAEVSTTTESSSVQKWYSYNHTSHFRYMTVCVGSGCVRRLSERSRRAVLRVRVSTVQVPRRERNLSGVPPELCPAQRMHGTSQQYWRRSLPLVPSSGRFRWKFQQRFALFASRCRLWRRILQIKLWYARSYGTISFVVALL